MHLQYATVARHLKRQVFTALGSLWKLDFQFLPVWNCHVGLLLSTAFESYIYIYQMDSLYLMPSRLQRSYQGKTSPQNNYN